MHSIYKHYYARGQAIQGLGHLFTRLFRHIFRR